MEHAASATIEWLEACRRRRSLAGEAVRATLADLTGIHVQVEPINADAERDGLRWADVQADVETVLRGAGLALHSRSAVLAEVASIPILHVDVMTMRLDGRYAYSMRLELWQSVRLIREPRIAALALTWSAPQVVGTVAAECLAEVRDAVRSAVARFAEEWRAATLDVRR